MKRVIFILICISLLFPVQSGYGKENKLDWNVKDFLNLSDIGNNFDKVLPKRSVGDQPQLKHVTTSQKKKSSISQQNKPEILETALCIEGALCSALPSDQFLSSWGEIEAGGRLPDMGALSFNVQWRGSSATESQIAFFAPIDCSVGRIKSVRATAYNSSGKRLTSGGPWKCSALSNVLSDIPVGSNINLVITGNNASGKIVYRGEASGITINAGKLTDAGTVQAEPFFAMLSGSEDESTLDHEYIGFTWKGPSGAASYRIQISKNKSFTKPLIDAYTTSSSFYSNSVIESRTYYWRVKANDAFNNSSDWSLARAFTVGSAPLFNTTAAKFINSGVLTTNSTTVSLALSASRNTGVAAYLVSENAARPPATASDWVPVALTKTYASVVPFVLSSNDGMKTLYVWFKDASGYVSKAAHDSILLDTKPPNSIITSGPSNLTNITTANVQFKSTKPGSTFQCSLDNDAYTLCASPHSFPGLGEGPHTIHIKATDIAGNTDPTPAHYDWTIDLTPPESMIASRPPDFTNSLSANFLFASTEHGSSFRCSLDSGAYAPCRSPQSYSGLAEGQHTMDIQAIDVAGNIEPTPLRVAWTIDLTPPHTVITGRPPALTNVTTDNFSFTSTKPGSTFQCQLDGSTYEMCGSPYSYAALTEGIHTFAVKAMDAVGNIDQIPATYTWTIDLTPPHTMITAQPADTTNATMAEFSFASTEDNSSFLCSLDGGTYSPCSNTQAYSNLPEGTHTVDVKATDVAGNTDPTPARYAWAIDLTPPESMIASRPPDFTNSIAADFLFASTEPGSTFRCSLDSGAYAPCNSPQTYSSLAEGRHTIDIRAIDVAGNIEPIPLRIVWIIDLAPPETSIMGQPPDTTNLTADSFSFFSTKPGSTFECRLDGNVYAKCSSPYSFIGLTEGFHTFSVKATDNVGNIDQTPAMHTWTIDTTPPDAMISAQPADPTNATTAEFKFTSTEDISSFHCSLDSGVYSPCSSPQAYSSLSEGTHTIDVIATDAAGNTDPIPAHYVWAIDLTPPDTAITIHPANPTNATTTNFTFSSSKPGSTFECSLDNGEYTTCSGPHTYSGLVPGSHIFAVKATDSVGNIDPSPALYAWDIDTTPPNTIITDHPSSSSSTANTRFRFTSSKSGSSFECQLDDGYYTVCSSPFSYTNLKSGSHTFTVRAVDAVGNADPTPESVSWVAILPPKNETPSGFINKGGAYYVHNNVVKLSLWAVESDGHGVKAYYASEDPTPPSPSDSGWITFTKKKEYRQNVDFSLSEGSGKKTVYVWFKDDTGTISDVKSDTIYSFNSDSLLTVFLVFQLVAIL